jgi:hypothetical protein
MGGDFRKCLGKGGGGDGAGQAWQLCDHISKMLPPGHTSDFEPHMHKYLQQPLPKHLEKKPMKKKKWSWIKDGKNNKNLSIWFIYSSMEESLLWGLFLSFLKFIYLGFLAWICLRKEKEEKR